MEEETRVRRKDRIRNLARRSTLARRVRRGVVLGFLAIGAGLIVWAAIACLFDPRDAFFSQNRLDRTLFLARAAVIQETGRPFRTPVIRAKHRIDVHEYLIERFGPQLDARYPNSGGPQRDRWLRDAAYLNSFAAAGIYLPERHEVWIIRSKLMNSESFREDPVRSIWMLTLHEAAHAADFARYGCSMLDDPSRDGEELRIWDSLIEGHADYVMVRIMKREMDDAEAEELYLIERAYSGSAYTQGRHFWKEVLADGATTADGVFSNPPRTMYELLSPRRYLERIETEPAGSTASNSEPTSGSPGSRP